jgi:hypothetical protein
MPYPWPLLVAIGFSAIGAIAIVVFIVRLSRFMPTSGYGNPDAGFQLFAKLFVDEKLRTERLLFFVAAGAGALFIFFTAVVAPMVVQVVRV